MDEAKALTVPEIEDEAIRTAISLRLQGYSWKEVTRRVLDAGLRGPCGGEFDKSDLYKRCQPYLKMIQRDEGFRALKTQVLDVAMEATAQVGQALRGQFEPILAHARLRSSVSSVPRACPAW